MTATMIVEFWEAPSGKNPVKDYIYSLDDKTKKKIIVILERCQTRDINYLYRSEILKKLSHGLCEIRILFNKMIYRIICVIRKSSIWLLHIVNKKKNRIVKKDLDVAKNRARELDRNLK